MTPESPSTDRITSNGNLKVTGAASGSTVEYSVDGSTWTTSFTPVQGNNSVYVRQKDSTGATSDVTPFSFELDSSRPTVDITQTKVGSGKAIQATFTFSKAVDQSSFTAQDVLLTGATMESFAFNGGTTYKAILTPSMSGGGKFSVAVNNAAYDDVNSNAGTGTFKIFDVTKAKATGGADWLVGTSGKNTLKGGSGDDIIRGGKGNDTISGDGGKDLLDFSDGTKGIKITLSQENTKYTTFDGRAAGLGIDKYRDMEGVIGTKFADTITGSSSSDVLAGLGGNDILRGGRGNDVFVFEFERRPRQDHGFRGYGKPARQAGCQLLRLQRDIQRVRRLEGRPREAAGSPYDRQLRCQHIGHADEHQGQGDRLRRLPVLSTWKKLGTEERPFAPR